MIAAVGYLLIALACQDVDRALGPTKPPPKANIATSPPVLLSLTCTFNRIRSRQHRDNPAVFRNSDGGK